MIALRIITALWQVVASDRTVHAGASSSAVSLWGSHHIANGTLPSVPPEVQLWVAFFATLFGGLSAAAVFVYTLLKTIRLMRQPKALD